MVTVEQYITTFQSPECRWYAREYWNYISGERPDHPHKPATVSHTAAQVIAQRLNASLLGARVSI